MPDALDADADTWVPVNKAETLTLPAGSKATFVFEPDSSGMAIDMVAVSKFPGLTYEVKVDEERRFGPTGIPPTDIDDAVTTHNPRLEAAKQLTVIVRNPSGTDREVAAQLRGVEA